VALAHMRWSGLRAFHFRVAPALLAGLVPPGLAIDQADGAAWFTILGFHVVGPVPRPLARVAARWSYRQINARTYVVGPAGPGIYVTEARVDRAWPLVARLVGEPYRFDRSLALTRRGARVGLAMRDVVLEGVEADVGRGAVAGVDAFLLERRWVYAPWPGHTVLAVQVAHPPWRAARLLVDEGPGQPALGHVTDDMAVDVVAATLRRLPPARRAVELGVAR
jgi:uncharacterized protein YqjF (DUF2071 family)